MEVEDGGRYALMVWLPGFIVDRGWDAFREIRWEVECRFGDPELCDLVYRYHREPPSDGVITTFEVLRR
jgi:hypothetical protein